MIFADGTFEDQLDDLALLVCQKYNFGNDGNWFFSFRMGLQGVRSRRVGIELHRPLVYEWVRGHNRDHHEHHIATMLFCMDSALECLVFSLNALGQAVDATQFRDIRDEADLRRVSPRDVTGPGKDCPLSGYSTFFPRFQRHLLAAGDLLQIIVDNHDVSKHRQHSFSGGTLRNDPPPGYFEGLGLDAEDSRRLLVTPYSEILIGKQPKLPMELRPKDLAAWTRLETIIKDFSAFIQEAVARAASDAASTIEIQETRLLPL